MWLRTRDGVLTGPMVELTSVHLLSGHSIKLFSNLPPCRLLSFWDSIQKVCLYIRWWLIQKLRAGQSTESKCQGVLTHKWGVCLYHSLSSGFTDHWRKGDRRFVSIRGQGRRKWSGVFWTFKDGCAYKLSAAVVACARLVQYHASQHCSMEREGFISVYPCIRSIQKCLRSYGQLMSYGRKREIFFL